MIPAIIVGVVMLILMVGACLTTFVITKLVVTDKTLEKNAKQNRLQRFNFTHDQNVGKQYDMGVFFSNHEFRNIVIYGLGIYCDWFLDDCITKPFEEIIFADGFAAGEKHGKKIYSKEDLVAEQVFEKCDVVVVTSFSSFVPIRKDLENLGCPRSKILAYEDLVYAMRGEMQS